MYCTYSGNVSNRFIMDDIVKGLWMDNYTVIVVDRGISDPVPIQSMLDLKFTMTCGLKKTPGLKRIIDGIDRNDIYTKKRMVPLKNTKVYWTDVTFLSGRLIIVYNPAMESLKKDHYYDGRLLPISARNSINTY